jgi:hypothetical protein
MYFPAKSTAKFAWQEVGLMLLIQCVPGDFARFQKLLAWQQVPPPCRVMIKEFLNRLGRMKKYSVRRFLYDQRKV